MSRIPFLNDLQSELERATLASVRAPARSRSGVLAAAVAFGVVILAGAVLLLVRSPEDVAAPTTTTSPPVVDAVSLPTEWARVPNEAVLSSSTNFMLSRVTRGSQGFLAVGNETAGSGQRNGMVFISETGTEWTRVDDPSVFDGINLEAVAQAGDVMVVGGISPDITAAFYTSADGTTWDAAPVETSGDLEGVIPHAIAPHDDGFVAVGSGLTSDGSDSAETGIVWFTDAEGTWHEAVAPEFAVSSLNNVLAVDGMIYIAGLSQIADGQSEPTIWTSDDDGATWTVTLLPRIEEMGFADVASIATSGGTWVAVGSEANSGAVWTSSDGVAWDRYQPNGDEFAAEKLPTRMHDVLVTDKGIVVIGADSLGAETSRITWVSADGNNWTRLDYEEPVSIEDASPVAFSLASDLSTIVAVGMEIAIEGNSLGAVWMSPPADGMTPLVPISTAEPEEPDDGTTDPGEALPEGWLRLGIDGGFAEGYEDSNGEWVDASLNPLLIREPSDVARLVVPGAFRLDAATGELTPWIVERIPRLGDGLEVASDGTVTMTYTVREEAVWEDGTPVTGADLAFTHELIMRYADQTAVDTSVHELVDTDSITVDGRSVTFRLTTPDTQYERLFEWVLPAHIIDLDTFLDDWNEELWPSAGPFRFVSFEVATAKFTEPSIVVVERNPNYWETDPATGDALPYLEGIELQAFPGGSEANDAARLIKARELDAVLGQQASSWTLSSYGDLDEQGLALSSRAHMLYEFVAFNLRDGRTEVNPNSNNDLLAYRQAVLSAIDRPALADSYGGPAVDSIVGLVIDRYGNDAWSAYGDTGRVQELLTGIDGPIEAIYTSSFADTTIAIGEAVAGQLTSAGIDTTTQFDGDFFTKLFDEHQFDLFALRLFPGSGGLGQVAGGLEIFAAGEGVLDWTGLQSEADRYADILEQARVEFDQDSLAELLGQAESVLADNALAYPLVSRQSTNVIFWPDRIRGIAPNRVGGWDTWNAAWWSPGS